MEQAKKRRLTLYDSIKETSTKKYREEKDGCDSQLKARMEIIVVKRWLSVDEVALYLGMSVHTIYEKTSKKEIPFKKIPSSNRSVFDRLAIDKWINEGK